MEIKQLPNLYIVSNSNIKWAKHYLEWMQEIAIIDDSKAA